MPVDAPLYPVNLIVRGRRCLVVGGGQVAARKVAGLVACGAQVHVIAPDVTAPIDTTPGVTIERRAYRAGDAAAGEYRLVLTASDDPAVNAAVYDEADAAGIWVNSADDPDHCTFTLPAVVRRGPLTVAVGTGGHSPAAAAWIRARLEAEFGPEYETLIGLLSDERRHRHEAGGSTEEVDWQRALDSDVLDLIRAGDITAAKERLKACLSSSSA